MTECQWSIYHGSHFDDLRYSMPELPEVETTCRGIAPHVINQTISQIIIREKRLRWPIPTKILQKELHHQKILSVTRRAKYIYIQFATGYLIIHLGMSGTLQIFPLNTDFRKHDHFECILQNGKILRFNDPRRFGCILWAQDPNQLAIIANLGPEPLSEQFSEKYLYQKAQRRHITIKEFIMNNHIVVGVGNIYASESLFLAGINPLMRAKELTLTQAKALCKAIRHTLEKAIAMGGTTLKDFYQSDGKPGYFSIELKVYGRNNESCYSCTKNIESIRIGQRMTYFCPQCQR